MLERKRYTASVTAFSHRSFKNSYTDLQSKYTSGGSNKAQCGLNQKQWKKNPSMVRIPKQEYNISDEVIKEFHDNEKLLH